MQDKIGTQNVGVMKLYHLMRNAFDRMANLVEQKWTGEIVVRVQVNKGGIRNAQIRTECPLDIKEGQD